MIEQESRAKITAKIQFAIDRESEMMRFIGAELGQWAQDESNRIQSLLGTFNEQELREFNEWLAIFRLASAKVDLNFARRQGKLIDPDWEEKQQQKIRDLEAELTRIVTWPGGNV